MVYPASAHAAVAPSLLPPEVQAALQRGLVAQGETGFGNWVDMLDRAEAAIPSQTEGQVAVPRFNPFSPSEGYPIQAVPTRPAPFNAPPYVLPGQLGRRRFMGLAQAGTTATDLAAGGRPALAPPIQPIDAIAQRAEPTQRVEEPEGLVIPDIPPELLGPTGRVFIHPNGRDYSTELSAVLPVPGQAGKFAASPLLVPGQTGIADLLAGKRPTPEQLRRAADYLGQRLQGGEEVAVFGSPKEAVQAEQARHSQRERQLAPYVRPHLKRDWKLDYQDRFGVDPDRLGIGRADGTRELGENWYVDPKVGRPFLATANPEPGKTWRLVFSDGDLRPAWEERGRQGFPLLVQRTDLKRPDWPKVLEAARKAQYEHPDARLDVLRLLGPDAATAVPRWTVVPHPSGQGFTVAPGDFGGQVPGSDWGPAHWQAATDRVNRLAAGGAVFPSYQTKDEAWDAVRAHVQSSEDIMRAEEQRPLPRQPVEMRARPGEFPTDEEIAARKERVDEQMQRMKAKSPQLYKRLPLLHPPAE